jgi:hypothetical protein
MYYRMKPWTIIGCTLLISAAACKKAANTANNGGGGTTTTTKVDSSYQPVDPPVAATIGFFGNGWAPRTFTAPGDTTVSVSSSLVVTDSLTIDVNNVLAKVPPTVIGNNSNLWIGQIITQPNLMQYIKDLSPNIIRAPAGSVSDIYFWNGTAANPAPADVPDSILNSSGVAGPTNPWYGGNTQSYTLSLANYYTMLAQTNSTGIITINYGYARYGTGPNPVAAAAHLAADWVRYDNGRTKFWEIGNETYGNWEAGYMIDVTKKPGSAACCCYGCPVWPACQCLCGFDAGCGEGNRSDHLYRRNVVCLASLFRGISIYRELECRGADQCGEYRGLFYRS